MEPPIGAIASGPVVASARRPRRGQHLALLLAGVPLLIFVVAAAFGPLVVRYHPITTRTGERLKPPATFLTDGSLALLGTDQVGRDLLAQVLQGARISLLVAAGTIIAAGLIGLFVDILAGYCGGVFDMVAMRLAEHPAWLSHHSAGDSDCRHARAQRHQRHHHARGCALGHVWKSRARRHAVDPRARVRYSCACTWCDRRALATPPSTLTPLIVISTVEVGLVIISEASLSFLGLGTPPDQPSWGLIVANGRAYLNIAWWISTMPGLALSLVVLAVGAFGD